MQPGILEALNELVEPSIRGDPEAALRWVSLSQRHLSAALAKRGFIAGQKLVVRKCLMPTPRVGSTQITQDPRQLGRPGKFVSCAGDRLLRVRLTEFALCLSLYGAFGVKRISSCASLILLGAQSRP